MAKFVGDLGATMHAGSIVIGEKLGLYKAMATPDKRTNTNERYVREWLNANAASGYIEYDADKDAYYMTEEQSFVMTNEENPAYLPGAFILATSALRAVPTLVDRFARPIDDLRHVSAAAKVGIRYDPVNVHRSDVTRFAPDDRVLVCDRIDARDTAIIDDLPKPAFRDLAITRSASNPSHCLSKTVF